MTVGSPTHRMRGALGLSGALLVTLAACSAKRPPDPAVPQFTTTASPSTAGTPQPFPTTCGKVATLDDLSQVLQVAVTGAVSTIVGVPEPSIGRTARLDCYYGLLDGQARTAAPVIVGLATYSDEAAAAKRMKVTVDGELGLGATASDVKVGSGDGKLLDSAKHILVATRGTLAVVITVDGSLITADQAKTVLPKLADKVLSR